MKWTSILFIVAIAAVVVWASNNVSVVGKVLGSK